MPPHSQPCDKVQEEHNSVGEKNNESVVNRAVRPTNASCFKLKLVQSQRSNYCHGCEGSDTLAAGFRESERKVIEDTTR